MTVGFSIWNPEFAKLHCVVTWVEDQKRTGMMLASTLANRSRSARLASKGVPGATPFVELQAMERLLVIHRGRLHERVAGIIKPATLRFRPGDFPQHGANAKATLIGFGIKDTVKARGGLLPASQIAGRYQTCLLYTSDAADE